MKLTDKVDIFVFTESRLISAVWNWVNSSGYDDYLGHSAVKLQFESLFRAIGHEMVK